MTDYLVTLTFQFPAWDETKGIEYFYENTDRQSAIRRAKQDAENDGHIDRFKGRTKFTATAA